MTRIADLKRNSSSLDERYNLSKTLEAAKHESIKWKRKYEVALSKQKAGEKQASLEVANLKATSSATETRLTAAREQTLYAQEEAGEWKRKYDVAVKETKSALEKAAAVQDHASKQTQIEAKIKDKASKIEQAACNYSQHGVKVLFLAVQDASSPQHATCYTYYMNWVLSAGMYSTLLYAFAQVA
ncbi:hypothetical protein Tco_1024266 [Tanacetum coccineum]